MVRRRAEARDVLCEHAILMPYIVYLFMYERLM